jgi:hypothetical protein
MNRTELIEKFGKTLRPLYKDMMSEYEKGMPSLQHPKLEGNISDYYFVSCPQWGNAYPLEKKHDGILFYGRATNNWGECYDVDQVFEPPYSDMFNAKDKMEWLVSGEFGNTQRPFVILLKEVSKRLLQDSNDWNQKIAWSEVCKIAPDSERFKELARKADNNSFNRDNGNPNDEEYELQYHSCVKILKEEIKFFSPEIIVSVTGANANRWDWAIQEALGISELKFSDDFTIRWSDRYVKGAIVNGIKLIICERPELRSPSKEADAINELVRRMRSQKATKD